MSDPGDGGSGSDSGTGYVHDPTRFDESGERLDGEPAERDRDADSPERRTTKAYTPEAPDSDGFDARGWLLVAALFVSFLVIPVVILFLPQLRPVIAALGLPFRDAYLVLPLVPALGLGALAVWVALSNRARTGQD